MRLGSKTFRKIKPTLHAIDSEDMLRLIVQNID